MLRFAKILFAGSLLTAGHIAPALADKIKNPSAVFAGLDKITGRIIAFEVTIDETVQFGSLQLTPRVCYSRPTYENPQTDTFVEVDEIAQNNEYKRLFTGWMFSASPGLSAIEHPVYDIWLTECKGGTQIIKTEPEKEDAPPPLQPLEAQRPARPPRAPARAQQPAGQAGQAGQPIQIDQRQQPTQRFFPTNQPSVNAPPANVGGGNRPGFSRGPLPITPPTPQ